jgi:hypothetical protein
VSQDHRANSRRAADKYESRAFKASLNIQKAHRSIPPFTRTYETMTTTTQDLHDRFEPHPDARNLTGHRDENHGIDKDVDYEPHPDQSIKLSPEHQRIIDHIINLYSGSSSEKDMEVYDTNAIYDDPLSYCDTRYKIAGTIVLGAIDSVANECRSMVWSTQDIRQA